MIYPRKKLCVFVNEWSIFAVLKINIMGRGDKKTKRGKIFAGSFGKHRMRVAKVVKKLTEKKA